MGVRGPQGPRGPTGPRVSDTASFGTSQDLHTTAADFIFHEGRSHEMNLVLLVMPPLHTPLLIYTRLRSTMMLIDCNIKVLSCVFSTFSGCSWDARQCRPGKAFVFRSLRMTSVCIKKKHFLTFMSLFSVQTLVHLGPLDILAFLA